MALQADDSFSQLTDALRHGNPEAWGVVVQRYAQALVRLAAGRIPERVRVKEPPEDVVQSVFKSFFRHHVNGEYVLADWEGLWGLLARITMCKCVNRVKYHHRQRRDASKEIHTEDLARHALDHEPRPEEVTDLELMLDSVMHDFDEGERQTVELARLGHTREEIAELVKCSERSVYRVLGTVKKRLERRLREDELA